GAVWFSGSPALALGTLGGVLAALVVLGLAGLGLKLAARRMARWRAIAGRPGLRWALAAIGGPRSEALSVVLSLGLGLSVLAVVGQIDANFRAAIARDLPAKAPSFFFIDLQDAELQPFLAMMKANPAVSKVESAPMLRGILTQINGRKARDVVGDHWVVMGDRGITFADAAPPGTKVTAGAWWPKGYTGPAQVSFAATEAAEMHLKLGDKLTLNILGRDIQATITSFRKVDFSSAGMGFVMAMDPAAVAGAPHSSIATVYAEAGAKLMGVLIRMLGTRAEAEDALQEVFTRVWLRAGRYDPSKGRGMTWLIALARNHAIDRLRARPDHVSDDLALEAAADPAPRAETRMVAQGEVLRINECFDALEPDRSAALRGAYLDGQSYADLATRFGVPLNTMRTWLRRSLARLRECMEA
ncbi:MAG: hypothetical protein B7Y02_16695, partial [Rhodobacterales bacterium 17-64-5]